MARGASAARRMELNRSRVDEVLVAVGGGLLDFGRQVVVLASANAPDSPYMPYPENEGLPNQGGVLVYFDGKKIYSVAGRGRGEPKPPRAARISRGRGLQMIVGWGFPGRFQEFGTAKMAPHPFFTPAFQAVAPRWQSIVARGFQYRYGKQGASSTEPPSEG
jgi:hypothetical protein